MKMTLDINIRVEGKDAEELLDTLLELQRNPLEPVKTRPGSVGHEFLTNRSLQIDLEDHSREGGIAWRTIQFAVQQDHGDWLRNMSWNTFLMEIQKPDGGKIRHLRNIGPVAIKALREVLWNTSADTNIGDDDDDSEPTP